MKRTVLLLFALTLVLAIPLAGCGLTHVAGSVLLGGGGLTMALMMVLAFLGTRHAAHAPVPAASQPRPAQTTTAPARPTAIIVEVASADTRPPEIEEVAAFFARAAVKESAPPVDGFAADELAFFAEGETLSLRPSDSSPSWRLS